MKTKLTYEKGRISLVVDHGKDHGQEKMALAAMTLFEGSGCWSLIDIRLSEHPDANPWSASGVGEDFYARHKPDSEEEAAYFKSKLKEYEEMPDGTLRWCTFRDIVRGKTEINGFAPGGYKEFKRPVFHKRADGLALLKEIQAFWEGFDGPIKHSKIDNPHAQPRASNIAMDFRMGKAIAKHQATKLKVESARVEP